jgi:hypothetical protein
LTQQISDGLPDKQVATDPLRSELLSVQQHAYPLVPGLFPGDQGAANLSPELGLPAGAGQQLGMHRLGGLQGLAVLADIEGDAGAPDADIGRLEPQVCPGADLGVIRAASAEASSRWVAAVP